MKTRLLALLFCLVAATLPMQAQSSAEALNQFKGKVLVLRHPLQSASQEYDATGKPLGDSPEGAWTVYGGVLIDKMKLADTALQIEGRRVLFLFAKGRLMTMDYELLKNRKSPPFGPEVKLVLRVGSLTDAAEVNAALNRVFAMNTSDLLESVPEFWREYLRDRLTYDSGAQRAEEFSFREPAPKQSGLQPLIPRGVVVRTEDDPNINAVYNVGAEVKAPRPLSTPEPEFSQTARYEKFQGVSVVRLIVAKDGSIHDIRVVRPVGLGLDEQAEARIKSWRFSPATRNGEPVSVEMNVEVAFNLY